MEKEKLEKELKVATKKWESVIDDQSDMVESIIDEYQASLINIPAFIAKLQDVESMGDAEWEAKNELEMEIYKLTKGD